MDQQPKEQVPPGSSWEGQSAESILYGLVYGILTSFQPMISERLNFEGADPIFSNDDIPGVVYDGVVIHMASGDYKVTVERIKAN